MIINLFDGEPIPGRSFRFIVDGSAPIKWTRFNREMYRGSGRFEVGSMSRRYFSSITDYWESDFGMGFSIPNKYLGEIGDMLKRLDKELDE